ncbi:MAG TPA: hypothetical protein PKI14_02565 [Fervidobacterium sp.]|nr:hypothetical protein [Fervidobacterium sp.]HOK87778.1 hypothetical protein [Fervidobacterium sp.]HOM74159.1 hypothetical protein [Fervidobacterium sp.]HOQ38888.1 hypothetical protein [Fervidobacterium sp.]HPP17811.1 hypothetical protein [Fervidobacterium sp.]
MEELRNIAEICITDQRIYDIITSIASMSEEEIKNFKSKVLTYFINKKSQEDIEAYKFYKLVLEDQNAQKILDFCLEIREKNQ